MIVKLLPCAADKRIKRKVRKKFWNVKRNENIIEWKELFVLDHPKNILLKTDQFFFIRFVLANELSKMM